MNLTVDQISALAPDSSSLSAGKKLGNAKSWQSTGRDSAAVWGECQGSALYQVRVDSSDLAYKCTCPSRKLPCKHVLGLLFLAAVSPNDVTGADAPEWVIEWLTKRSARAQQREEKKQNREEADPEAQAAHSKRAEKRLEKVVDGVARLDLWLNDLVRNGLAGLDIQPPSFWEEPAKRLVDAQAPGLASRLRRIGEIPGSSPDWPRRLLNRLGRLALLTHAFRRLGSLDASLQADVRQLIGWTVSQEELSAQGEVATDCWFVAGQVIEQEDRLRVQRSWLLGERTGRSGLVLQFSAAGQPFPEMIAPGARIEGDLVFWPSAFPQRAKFTAKREESSGAVKSPLVLSSIEEFLKQVAAALAKQPWLDRFLCPLKNVIPVARPGAPWLVCDSAGQVLPMARPESWTLLAVSGGRPIDLVAEWDGEALLPLGVFSDDRYHLLTN